MLFLISGDTRSNENIGLTSLHTLFLRLHNNIALSLSNINTDWSDDVIYHETRRIVIAILEHIIYDNFIPVMIGPSRSNFGIYHYDSSVKEKNDLFGFNYILDEYEL
jgi:peroxidase